MAWNNTENVVKKDGKCWNSGMHKYCFYWKAKHTKTLSAGHGQAMGFFCSLFNKDKEGYDSLPECNAKYGQTYDGRQIID